MNSQNELDWRARMERQLQTLVEESREACNTRADIAEGLVKYKAEQSSQQSSRIPPWLFPLILSLAIQAAAGFLFFGQFNGKFEEFRTAVYQRLDRIERRDDSERTRAPAGYASPPVAERPR